MFCSTMKRVPTTVSIFTVLVSLLVCSSLDAQAVDLAGIAHVAFRVTDVPKSREFYKSLGFEQSFEFADAGKTPVSYIKVNDRQFIELYGGASDSQPAGLMHVCYEAADIAALWNEYTKRGLNPPEGKKGRAGNQLFMFRDPEDQLIEYTQYLPGSLHSEDRGKHLGSQRVSRDLLRASVLVKDVTSERAFYTRNLGFAEVSTNGAIRLRLPGDSGEEVELQAIAPSAKPRMVFAVPDLPLAEKDLRSRGLALQTKDGSAALVDPDGVIVEFASPDRKPSSKH
jgi:catechol 2,3-dioxygenase-like lactoylglutathione lyase family enzyme